MKKLLLALVLLCAPAAAWASNCSGYSYTLTNGTTADATQVMSNFNTILGCANNNLANSASGVNSNITSFTQGVTFGSTLGVTGNATVGGTLGVTGVSTFTGNVGVGAAPTVATLDVYGTNIDVRNVNGPILNMRAATAAGGGAAIESSFSTGGYGPLTFATSGATQLSIATSGAATFTSSVTATSFSGAGTGLTGTAASLTAGAATTATNQSGGTISATSGTVSGALSVGSFTGTALASSAQTLTGSSTTQAITPAGFAGSASISANGYYPLPGGLYIQWGNTGAISANTAATVTLPYASCGTIYSIQATKVIASGSVNDSENLVNVGTTQFQITNGGTAAINAYWLVICK